MKRIFLVDTENMAAHWIGLLPNLNREDKIILMYTKKTPHISFDSFKEALDHSDKVNLIEWILCDCGSENALVSFWSKRERFIKRLDAKRLKAYLGAPKKEKPGEVPNGEELAKTEQTRRCTARLQQIKEALERSLPLVHTHAIEIWQFIFAKNCWKIIAVYRLPWAVASVIYLT